MRSLRRFRQAAAEHVPADSGDQKKKGGGSGERGEGRASFGRRLRLIGWRRRSGLRRRADLQREDPDQLGDVLELGLAEVGNSKIEPPPYLTI